MRTSFAIPGLLTLVSSVLAAAADLQDGLIGLNSTGTQIQLSDDAKEIVIMFQKDERPDYKAVLEHIAMSNITVIREWNNPVFAGMEIRAGNHCIDAFNAMSEVAFVEEKTVIQSFVETKAGAPWGLQRISNAAGASGSAKSQDFTYSFNSSSLGAGVDIYVIDTGVRTTHAVFTGRATQGFSATGSAVDGDGHGTHVAGTAGGAKFGVAQGANIIAVKVLGDDGSGSSSDTIAGMDWVINNHNKRKTQPGFVGSIMSMSWGLQGTARSVDEVITGASEAGIHVSVAAGNDGTDACASTPAQLGGKNSSVVTVGSINIENAVSSFSNIGTCVDIYAPGEEILSAWNTGDNIINFLSGTSMACPHTTGVMATLMAEDTSLGQDPAALKKKLLATARSNKVTGNLGGSANLLLSNGVDGGIAKRLLKNYVVPEHTGSPAAQAMQKAEKARELEKWIVVSDDSPLRF